MRRLTGGAVLCCSCRPNMGGKSVLIRQAALTIIMAQVSRGCWRRCVQCEVVGGPGGPQWPPRAGLANNNRLPGTPASSLSLSLSLTHFLCLDSQTAEYCVGACWQVNGVAGSWCFVTPIHRPHVAQKTACSSHNAACALPRTPPMWLHITAACLLPLAAPCPDCSLAPGSLPAAAA